MAAKQAVKTAKAPTPNAVKAKGAANMPKEDAATSAALIPVVNPKALSVDVGPKVLQTLAAYSRDERQVRELQQSMEAKRYDALSNLTAAIVKAATADKTIKLDVIFAGSKLDKIKLNNQLGIALGFKSVMTVGKAGAEKKRVEWAPSVADYVKPQKDDPEDIGRQKSTVRTNFAHMLTKCTQAAIGIIDDGIKVNMDKATGTLLLSGPAVKSHFGEATVLLNEKQTVKTLDKKGNVTGEKKLKVKPSFTEIARRAAEAHGKVHAKRVDSRTVTVDPQKHVTELCNLLVKSLEKLTGEPSEGLKKALESAASAIDKVL